VNGSTSGASVDPVRSISLDEWLDLKTKRLNFDGPLVITQGMVSACSIRPELFADNYPDLQVKVTVDLPNTGVPYCIRGTNHIVQLPLASFVHMLKTGTPCYLNQLNVHPVWEAVRGVKLGELRLDEMRAVNLWMGRGTKSGLHFDFANNILIQAYGTKTAILVDPRYSASVYAFYDVPSKSQIDPEAPDLIKFPRFAHCTLLYALLRPGDLLYIPRGWWHFLRADDVSISLNCWYGQSMPQFSRLRQYLLSGGPMVGIECLRDFIFYGVLRNSYQQRLFSPPSLGVQCYRRISG
jgi:hypothetical protein